MECSEVEDQVRQHLPAKTNEFIKNCNQCEYAACIDIDSEVFPCLVCDKTICPKCDTSPAHIGMTCQENRVKKESLKDQTSGEQDMGSNIVKCPKCGSYCELYDGCSFMTCLSSFCLKRTHFCNLCGKQLTDKGHWGHYTLKGPYGDSCNIIDGIEDAPGVGFEGTEMPIAKVKENHRKKMEEMKQREERKDDQQTPEGEAVLKAKVEIIEDDYFPDFLKDPDALNENISKLSKKRETRKKKTSNKVYSDDSFD